MPKSLFIFLFSFFLIWMVAKEVTSCSQEDYWKTKLPNVPIPKLISNNLFHSISENNKDNAENGETKVNVDQPYTVGSWKYKEGRKDDGENGKMKANVAQPYTVGSWKYKDESRVNQPYTVGSWKYKKDSKVDQPYTVGSWKYKEDSKVAQPYTVGSWKYKEERKVDQPYTVGSWKYKEDSKVDQPYTVGSWKYKEDSKVAQPYTVGSWKYKEESKVDQPYTVGSWKYKEDSKVAQPYTVGSWKYKEESKVSQPYTVGSWKYKQESKVDQPYTVGSWKYKEDNKDNEENGKMKANVAQPYTVGSWKYKEDSKVAQPYTVGSWKYKEDSKVAQPYTVGSWKYNDESKVTQPYTVGSWKYKEDSKDSKENGKTKDNVAQPYTVGSWKYKEESQVAQPYTVGSWKYKEDNKERDAKDKSVNDHQSHSHLMHHMSIGEDKDMVGGSVFFTEENLKLGKKLRHDFQKNPKANFLPRDIASSIPFAVDKYSEILDRFSVEPNSAEATSIKEVLSLCLERPHVKKENRTCVQSMEDLVDFVIKELGTNNVKLATMTTLEDKVPIGMQDYSITKLNKLNIPKGDGVACHKMVYPYAVYWCHHQQDIGQYAVTLVNNDGITVDTTAVCHYDTYAWDPEVPALKYLGIRPGDAPVCHFAAINDMFWSLNGKTTTVNSGVAVQ